MRNLFLILIMTATTAVSAFVFAGTQPAILPNPLVAEMQPGMIDATGLNGDLLILTPAGKKPIENFVRLRVGLFSPEVANLKEGWLWVQSPEGREFLRLARAKTTPYLEGYTRLKAGNVYGFEFVPVFDGGKTDQIKVGFQSVPSTLTLDLFPPSK